MRDRFELFESYCLPSVTNQSDLDFNWFIYFDKNTPEPFKSRALHYEKKYDQISIFWETRIPLHRIQNKIVSYAHPGMSRLLTNRLANDDVLKINLISELKKYAQSCVSESQIAVLNYPNGYILNGSRLYFYRNLSNAFSSLLEPIKDTVNSVWSRQHVCLSELGPVNQMSEEHMWLQLLHGNNVFNGVRGRRVNIDSMDIDSFAGIIDQSSDNKWEIFLDNAIFRPGRLIKEGLLFLLNKVQSAKP